MNILTEQNPSGICTHRATPFLRHSTDKTSVAVAQTEHGTIIQLCSGCFDAIEARKIAEKYGDTKLTELRSYIWRELIRGVLPFPTISTHRANQIWFHLKIMETKGFVYRTSIGFSLKSKPEINIAIGKVACE